MLYILFHGVLQYSNFTMFTCYQDFMFHGLLFKAVGRLCGSKLEEKDSQVFRQKSIVNYENNGNQDTLEAVLQDKEAQSNEPYRCSCLGEYTNILVLFITN